MGSRAIATAILEPASSKAALPVCLWKENSHRLDSLWWVMHQSDEAERLASVVTLYLDESATDDASPIAVVGGLLLNKSHFKAFDPSWTDMLVKHSIQAPLHIKDFRRPAGRLADVTVATKRALFTDAVEIINRHKVYSIAATITTEEYKKYFDERFRKEGMSLYGQCFIMCVEINHHLAKQNNYRKRIPFLLDSGNPYADHVRAAHAEMQEKQWDHLNVGSLTFDDDKFWTPLQAADVIAWASRIRARSEKFRNGYEPLAGLFDEAHVQEKYPETMLARISESVEALRQSKKITV